MTITHASKQTEYHSYLFFFCYCILLCCSNNNLIFCNGQEDQEVVHHIANLRGNGPASVVYKTDDASLDQGFIQDIAGKRNIGLQGNNHQNLISEYRLPSWMKEYSAWHKKEISEINATNWMKKRYLVLHCPKTLRFCGGLSDRLKPLPLLLLTAHLTGRLLFIHWDNPARLEEFLTPNKFNWTIPDFLLNSSEEDITKSYGEDYQFVKKLRDRNGDSSKIGAVFIKLQQMTGGENTYEAITASMINKPENENVDTYKNIYHDLFHYLFIPSKPIQALIDEQMERSRLIPGEYAVAHYRAFYKRTKTEKTLKNMAINAVNCASNLNPGGPVYFASDSKYAVESALAYGKEINRSVVAYTGQEPLHIDRAYIENPTLPPSAFYSVFVDLYLMGNSRCVAHGIGGFGLYASLMSYDSSCRLDYMKNKTKCDWKDK